MHIGYSQVAENPYCCHVLTHGATPFADEDCDMWLKGLKATKWYCQLFDSIKHGYDFHF